MRTLISTPAFDFEELRFDHGDVVLAAVGWGEWERLERLLGEGLACLADADRRGEQVDAGALHAAVVAFRRSRGLLAGEDYLHWLADRSLTADDLSAHLTRRLLREQIGQRLADVLAEHSPSPEQLLQTARAEAILGGELRAWADRLARCAAAARGLSADGDPPPSGSEQSRAALLQAAAGCVASGLTEAQARERAARVAALLAAERGFTDRVVTPERVEARLAEHRLDWQRLVWQEALFTSEGAAREAALWVREHGLTLEEVAGMAHADTDVREAYCSEVPELSGVLAAAMPGELLGPLARGADWRLVCLRERAAPAACDATLRERAGAEIIDDALARHLAGRVSWHGER